MDETNASKMIEELNVSDRNGLLEIVDYDGKVDARVFPKATGKGNDFDDFGLKQSLNVVGGDGGGKRKSLGRLLHQPSLFDIKQYSSEQKEQEYEKVQKLLKQPTIQEALAVRQKINKPFHLMN